MKIAEKAEVLDGWTGNIIVMFNGPKRLAMKVLSLKEGVTLEEDGSGKAGSGKDKGKS